MKKESLRIIFIGTPDFAVASLQAILEEGFQVVAVITAPDKPAGRGLKLHESPVKVFALEQGLPVLQPINLKNPEFLEELRNYQADLQVVIAFRMLPELVWNMPRLGTFNLHASLLPNYRGAAPINWAIINGEKETGVSTFFLKHEIDTGNIIYREKVAIGEEQNAGELHDVLMNTGAGLVVKTLHAIEENNYPQTPQDTNSPAIHAPKIFKEDCRISWEKNTAEVYNLIRGLSPYPAAYTLLGDLSCKIYRAEIDYSDHGTPGAILSDGKNYLKIACSDGYIALKELQLEGKKRMNIQDFLRGFDFAKSGIRVMPS